MPDRHPLFEQFQTAATAGRVVVGVFGFVFLGIGLTVLVSLWLVPFGQFGSPPLIFRLVGSFISLAFIAVGGVTALAAVFGKLKPPPIADLAEAAREAASQSQTSSPDAAAPQAGYGCPHCGAPLGENADVSPHGDVKCNFCKRWYNIHRRSTSKHMTDS